MPDHTNPHIRSRSSAVAFGRTIFVDLDYVAESRLIPLKAKAPSSQPPISMVVTLTVSLQLFSGPNGVLGR